MNADYEADYTGADVEIGLNKEVDHAISNFRDEPEAPYGEHMEQQEIADRISRIASEIQQVIPLVLPKKTMGVPGEEEQPQDPALVQVAKTLLMAQIDKLKCFIGKLE